MAIHAQYRNAVNQLGVEQLMKTKMNRSDATFNKFEGSPYVFDATKNNTAKVFYLNGKDFDVYDVNFNLMTKTLESKISKDSVFVIDDSPIKQMVINRKYYKIESINNEKNFFEILFKSTRFELLKGFKLAISYARTNSLTQLPQGADKFDVQNEYFVKKNEGTIEKIKLNKKNVLKLVEDKVFEIEQYTKKTKLDYSRYEDVIKILTYYESL